MYEADPDPYCYRGTDILKNKAGLTSPEALEEFETAMTFARSEEPLPAGRLSVTHYKNIHHHLFQDVYSWAGSYRTVRVSKGQTVFCYPENISAEMTRLFAQLKNDNYLRNHAQQDFSLAAAHFLAELNAIHPFREGNGRTQLTFLAVLAESAAHPINLNRLDPDETLSAMIESFNGNECPLATLIEGLAR